MWMTRSGWPVATFDLIQLRRRLDTSHSVLPNRQRGNLTDRDMDPVVGSTSPKATGIHVDRLRVATGMRFAIRRWNPRGFHRRRRRLDAHDDGVRPAG